MTAHHAPMMLGAAIREVRGNLTQDELAAKLNTDQGTVSRWENGKLRPDLNDIKAIEDAVGVPHGTVLRRAGYIAEVVTVEDALEADASVPREHIPAILAVVDAARSGRLG